MKICIKYNNKILSENIALADDLPSRLLGLMFKRSPNGDGLLLDPCNSIHTFFMRYPLDVAFISSDNKVVKVIRNLMPWKMTWIYFKASKVLELPAGKMPQDLKEGDLFEVIRV
ncbi:MAG: DUF192 domain-containing protein [Bacteriovoracaceae bacterium]